MDSKIILFVGNAPKNIKQEIRESFPKAKVILLRHVAKNAPKKFKYEDCFDEVLYVDFTDRLAVNNVLRPYRENIIAVTTHGESGVNRLIQILSEFPYQRTPTKSSLLWATDKYEMRRRMKLFDASICPKFTRVKNSGKEEVERIEKKVGFPMIIKPANLASSLLVSICYHEEELVRVLNKTFRKLRSQYAEYDRSQLPTIIAEEYMEGDMYSIDSFVDDRGRVTHCPMVRVIRGIDVGHDDFYNYIHMTPAALKSKTVQRAEQATESAIHSLGLRSTTTHVELIKTDNDWRIIEVGARMGGFRHDLYKLSYGIEYRANDIKVRIPMKVHVNRTPKGHAAQVKWFSPKEGEIIEMQGVKKMTELRSCVHAKINLKVGDRARLSKNGGKAVFQALFFNKDRSKLQADLRRLEQLVNIKVK